MLAGCSSSPTPTIVAEVPVAPAAAPLETPAAAELTPPQPAEVSTDPVQSTVTDGTESQAAPPMESEDAESTKERGATLRYTDEYVPELSHDEHDTLEVRQERAREYLADLAEDWIALTSSIPHASMRLVEEGLAKNQNRFSALVAAMQETSPEAAQVLIEAKDNYNNAQKRLKAMDELFPLKG